MLLSRFFSPSVNVRLFDPMPLPRRSAAGRRERIAVARGMVAGGGEAGAALIGGARPPAGADTKTHTGKHALKPRKASARRFTYKIKKIPVSA